MKKVAWVMPSFLEGSGGHRTIFQNIQYLIDKGCRCDVYVQDDGTARSADELKASANKYFGNCTCNFFLGFQISPDYDLIFATAWFTAKVVRDVKTSAKKAYFIQDFEAWFNPMGDGYLLACNSYCYGLQPITIGRWLTHQMITEYGLHSQYFDFCSDHEVYRPIQDVQKENAVCFVYQPDKPRRCSTIGIEALGIVKYLRPDVKIYLYGSKMKGDIWFEHENLGILSIEQCNNLYNRCRAGLCISSSNPSRIPFEMMTAGLPVVDLYRENNLYDMPNGAVKLAHYTPESIAQALISVLDSPALQKEMSENGIRFMREKSLSYGFEQFYQAVLHIMDDTVPPDVECGKIYTENAIIADVFTAYKEAAQVNYINQIGERGTFLDRLKRNPWLRRSRLLRRLWHRLKNIFR